MEQSNEPHQWTLVCNERVIGSKTKAGVNNLLRLHKKKCKICYDYNYVCVDESGMKPKVFKNANHWKEDRKRYENEITKAADLGI